MVLPMDTSLAKVPAVVRMTCDENNLCILAVCYTNIPGPYMVESLKRDFNFQNDNFIFLLILLMPEPMVLNLVPTLPARNGMAA
jgi:hypothetical protein